MSQADLTTQWVTINGAELYVEVLGAGKDKPVLIAHHGGAAGMEGSTYTLMTENSTEPEFRPRKALL